MTVVVRARRGRAHLGGPGAVLGRDGRVPFQRAASSSSLPGQGRDGAEQIVRVAAPTLLLLYSSRGVDELVNVARHLPADEGANVMILTPHDVVVTERPSLWLTSPRPPMVPVVGCSQLALDCLTGPGRMPAEGDALLTWMSENESKWRLPSLPVLGAAR